MTPKILHLTEKHRISPLAGALRGVSEGTRTPDRLDHNQELYQLSYAHQVRRSKSTWRRGPVSGRTVVQRPERRFGQRERLARRELGAAPGGEPPGLQQRR